MEIKDLVPWVITHGYLLFFIAATFEGTLITIAAGVAVGLGYFDFSIVLAIGIAGDLVGDTIYYFAGYYTRSLFTSRLAKFIHLTPERMSKITSALEKQLGKTVLLIKISIGALGIVVIGATRIPFKKFMAKAVVVSIPKSIIFVLIGFFSAKSYIELSSKIQKYNFVSIIFSIIILTLLIFIYKKAEKKLKEKIENKNKL